MEAEKFSDVLSAGWTPRGAHGVIPESGLSPEAENQGTSGVDPSPRAAEDQCLNSCRQTGSKNREFFFFCAFFLVRRSVHWMMPACTGEGSQLYPVHTFKC